MEEMSPRKPWEQSVNRNGGEGWHREAGEKPVGTRLTDWCGFKVVLGMEEEKLWSGGG